MYSAVPLQCAVHVAIHVGALHACSLLMHTCTCNVPRLTSVSLSYHVHVPRLTPISMPQSHTCHEPCLTPMSCTLFHSHIMCTCPAPMSCTLSHSHVMHPVSLPYHVHLSCSHMSCTLSPRFVRKLQKL